MTKTATSLPLGREIHVEKLIPGGRGYARASDGRVVLLGSVVPGDVVSPIEAIDRGGYVDVTHWRLIQASNDRVTPICSVAERCGGCDWMMLTSAAQSRHKLALVREALARTGKIFELPNELELVQGSHLLAYRSRIRLQVSPGGEVGFYSAASHTLIEAPSCAVGDPLINRALARLRQLGKEYTGSLAAFAHVEIRTASDDTVLLHFTRKDPTVRLGPVTARLLEQLKRELTVSIDRLSTDRGEWQRYPLLDQTYLLAPPGTFTQVNWEVNQKLVAAVVAGVKARNVQSFADLYCGSGNFTLPLLAKGLVGTGVESSSLSIDAARRAADEQKLESAAFIAGNAEELAKTWAKRGQRYDLVLIDPPRAGVKSGLTSMAELALRYVVICSCNPVTLARDLKKLLELGFKLTELSAFDMFPQTHHVEVLAWLERS